MPNRILYIDFDVCRRSIRIVVYYIVEKALEKLLDE